MSVFERGVLFGRRSALLAAWFAVLAAESTAENRLWNLPNNGTFNVAANWFGGVPGSEDVARFEITNSNLPHLQRTYSVIFDNSPMNQQLVVEDDNVTFDLRGNTYTATNAFVAVALGTVPNRSGNLTVTGGTLNLPSKNPTSATDLEIAPVANAKGVLTVGAGGRVNGRPDVIVGLNGNGTLDINSGGRVDASSLQIGVNSNSTGMVKVTGKESLLVAWPIGFGENSGGGTLEVTAGGQVKQASNFSLIWQGTAKIDGVGSMWEAGSIHIGSTRQATLEISGGAQVVTNDILVDGIPTAQIKIASTNPAADSILNVGRSLLIGNTLIGATANGTLVIQVGGTVDGASIEIKDGLLSLEGGTLRATQGLTFSEANEFSWTAGTLQVATFPGNLVVPNGGVLAPWRSSPGTTVKGSYNQQAAGAVLAVDISGASIFGELAVEEAALLGGSLQVSLKDGFVPSPSDTYDILQSGVILSAFANVANGQRLMTSDGLGSFVVNYGPGNPLPNHVILSAFAPGSVLPGDYNQNGTVDAADYVVWRNNLGSGTSLPNDTTPGVGQDDYTR